MALYRLFVDSSNGVDIDPEYNYKNDSRKVEDRHRARSGAEYVYKWGEYDMFKFGLTYVNSSDMSIINSWWNSNTDLLFMEVGGTDVYSVHILNKSKPIDQFVKPYNDLFQGKVELGTY